MYMLAALFVGCASPNAPPNHGPNTPGPQAANDSAADPPVVCLLYHRFVTADEFSKLKGDERHYCISIDKFEAQLRRLRELNYASLRASDLIDIARGVRRPSGPSVHITIDDGCRSFARLAEPVLRRHGFQATVFVTA